MAGSPTKMGIPDEKAAEKLEIINDTHGNNIDPEAEKKLLRKCDLRVLPPLFVLFLLAYVQPHTASPEHILILSADSLTERISVRPSL